MSDYLVIDQLSKVYPTASGPAVILEDVNLRIRKGEFVTLIGHSGCGKSTVLSIVAGLNEATAGGIILGGKELDGPGPDRGVVFQSPCLLPWLTAMDNVLLGVNQVFPSASKADRHQWAEHYLGRVGLFEARFKRPAELSQGMRQRVALARAFALKPRMLLLDEPFGMLDSLTRCELQEVLLDLWEKNHLTTLMVTHDIDEALFLSDRVIMMTNGPAATIGEVLEVPFGRPRNREQVLEDPRYYDLREQLIGFLTDRAGHHHTAPSTQTQLYPA
jgi:nitrate/nitrite transport system ATP-binding protein